MRNGRSSVAPSTALLAASVLPDSTHRTAAPSSQSLTWSAMTSPGRSPVRTMVAAARASGSARRSASQQASELRRFGAGPCPFASSLDGGKRGRLLDQPLGLTVRQKAPKRARDPMLAVDGREERNLPVSANYATGLRALYALHAPYGGRANPGLAPVPGSNWSWRLPTACARMQVFGG
jgi:hypothetical protein